MSSGKSIFRMLLLLLAVAVALPLIACETPVYRYAMYRWAPAPFEVYFFHSEELTEDQKELHAELIQREPFVLITPLDVAGDDPLKLLVEQPFVRYDRSSFGGRQVSQFLRKHHLDVRPGLELDELDAIVKMVACGLGVALVPEAGLWLERQPTVRVLRLGGATFHRELVLVGRHSARQLPVQQLFRRCVREVLAEQGRPAPAW